MARGEHEVPESLGWLSEREAAWLDGMRFTKRRTEYLLRRWVGKQAVATATGLDRDPTSLARIEVANRPTGAPYVLVDGSPYPLDLSLSDRAGWAVCLVGPDLGGLGCDLEIVEPRSEGFVRDFLTVPEQEYVAASRDQAAAANLLWSAKESALKVLQTGLRRDTRSVEVTLHGTDGDETVDGWRRLAVRTEEGTVLPGWWRRSGVFLLTMAAREPFDPPVALPGSGDLEAAEPVHSWLQRPLADGG